jgi:ComF family protein
MSVIDAAGNIGLRAARTAHTAAGRLLDLIYPPQCLACRTVVDRQGMLCPDCWSALVFVTPPHCARCGLPFEYDIGDGALCGACLAREPVYQRARAALVYDDASRPLILSFKHGDRLHAAAPYAAFLARAGAALIGDADVIVPVPLHWRRLFRRRYNQSAILAQRLGQQCGKPVLVDALRRVRPTPSQGGLSRDGRLRNVRGAFQARLGATPRLAQARILLIDDVLTTGATVEACARALLRAGAASVDVLVLARVVRAGDASG